VKLLDGNGAYAQQEILTAQAAVELIQTP